MSYYDSFDVAVCGGGHAGIEASLACARMGLKTILIINMITVIKINNGENEYYIE